MKNLFLTLMAVAVATFASCTKDSPVKPDDPTESCVEEFYCGGANGEQISYAYNPATKSTFVCLWYGTDYTNTPFLQKINNAGQVVWSNWVRIQNQKGNEITNETAHFAVTPKDETIHIYSVMEQDNGSNVTTAPYINKVSSDGELMWGENGIQFCKFSVNSQYPAEGYAISDNKGGAWIAASNGDTEIIVRHVDANGNLGTAIPFQNTTHDHIRRPQLMLMPDGNIMIIYEMANNIPDTIMYYADFRMGIISASNGSIQDLGNMYTNSLVDFGTTPDIYTTSDGFYSVILASDKRFDHILVRRYRWDGTPATDIVDVTPRGIDPKQLQWFCVDSEDNMVIVMSTKPEVKAWSMLSMNIMYPDGKLKFTNEYKFLFETEENFIISSTNSYLMQKNDGSYFINYVITSALLTHSSFMWGMKFDSEGNVLSNNSLIYINHATLRGSNNYIDSPYHNGTIRLVNVDADNNELVGYKITTEK